MLLGFMTALHVFSPTLGGMFPFPELEQKSLFDLRMECEMSLPPSNIVVNKVAITKSQANLNSEFPMSTKTLDHTLINKINAVLFFP